MRVSVIIPLYNALPYAKECLASIFANPPAFDFEILLVNNGSSGDVEQWIFEQERVHPQVRHLSYGEPLGFACAVNAGAAASTGEVLILLNTDTIVSRGWIDRLCDTLLADPTLGVATPSTNWGDFAQMDGRTANLRAPQALALVASQPNPVKILYVPQRVFFFCAAIRRTVWLELGGLDERYSVGNFEDDDFCLRLRLAGYRLGILRHVFVFHYGSATFHGNRLDQDTTISENSARFAARAREFAAASNSPAPHWPKRQAPEVSVVIHAHRRADLDRTLRSIENQTISGLEIVGPGPSAAAKGTWIAHLSEGDVFYPFHLESLLHALTQFSADAAFSDPWTRARIRHPDAARPGKSAPLHLSGWMHHGSLDPGRLWEQSSPVHLKRLTWEPGEPFPESAPTGSIRGAASEFLAETLIEPARSFYRRKVALETRHAIDARVRKALFLPPWRASEERVQIRGQERLREVGERLKENVRRGTDAGKFPAESAAPAVILFNTVAWNTIVQRPHHFARGLARRGHPVFWVETMLADPSTWSAARPLAEPFPGIRLVRLPGLSREIYQAEWDSTALEAMSSALAHLAGVYGLSRAVSLVQYPRWEPLAMELRRELGWRVIYDCLDDQEAFSKLFETALADHEDRLIAHADAVITSSVVLRDRMRPRRKSMLLHNAADFDLFSSSPLSEPPIRLPRPVIGFFGAIADWLDIELIRAAAGRFPQWSFVFIGPHNFSAPEAAADWARAVHLPNVIRLPEMDPHTLAAHLQIFDVCVVPFRDIPVTRAMNAVKVYEYLAAGKPVVSRDLPEIRHLAAAEPSGSLVAFYSTPDEFFECLRRAAGLATPEHVRLRQDFARRNDWSQRTDALAAEIRRLFR